MIDRIHWRCACGNLLSAPAHWRGRAARCPACDALCPVPETSRPDAETEAAGRDVPFRERRATAAPGRTDGGSPYSGWEMRTEGGPPPDDPFFERFRVDPAAARRAARRKWWLLLGIVASLTLVVGGGLVSRHLWKTRWSAAARMENAGFGRRLQQPLRPAPWQEALAAVSAAQARVDEANDSPEAAARLRDTFTAAIRESEGMPLGARAHLYNNAAWFLATTPFPAMREPDRALGLARSAVEWTGRKDAGTLDTLAEALFANHRAAEAAIVEAEAGALDPDNAFYRQQEAKFLDDAGLPAPSLVTLPSPAPSSPPAPPSPSRAPAAADR